MPPAPPAPFHAAPLPLPLLQLRLWEISRVEKLAHQCVKITHFENNTFSALPRTARWNKRHVFSRAERDARRRRSTAGAGADADAGAGAAEAIDGGAARLLRALACLPANAAALARVPHPVADTLLRQLAAEARPRPAPPPPGAARAHHAQGPLPPPSAPGAIPSP